MAKGRIDMAKEQQGTEGDEPREAIVPLPEGFDILNNDIVTHSRCSSIATKP